MFKIKENMQAILFFNSKEAYAHWLGTKGHNYNLITVCSRNAEGITIEVAIPTESEVVLSETKLWEEQKKDYPLESHANRKFQAMVNDYLKPGVGEWNDIMSFAKKHSITLFMETFYRLWKEKREAFEMVKTVSFGWGRVSTREPLQFLSTIDDDEFLGLALDKFEGGNYSSDNDIMSKALIARKENFLKHFFRNKKSMRGVGLGKDLLSMDMMDAFREYFSKLDDNDQKTMITCMIERKSLDHLVLEHLEKTDQITHVIVRRALILNRQDILDAIRRMKSKCSDDALALLEE
jgi:hypothetical protein